MGSGYTRETVKTCDFSAILGGRVIREVGLYASMYGTYKGTYIQTKGSNEKLRGHNIHGSIDLLMLTLPLKDSPPSIISRCLLGPKDKVLRFNTTWQTRQYWFISCTITSETWGIHYIFDILLNHGSSRMESTWLFCIHNYSSTNRFYYQAHIWAECQFFLPDIFELSASFLLPTTFELSVNFCYWPFQNVFMLDYGHFQHSDTEWKGTQIHVNYVTC